MERVTSLPDDHNQYKCATKRQHKKASKQYKKKFFFIPFDPTFGGKVKRFNYDKLTLLDNEHNYFSIFKVQRECNSRFNAKNRLFSKLKMKICFGGKCQLSSMSAVSDSYIYSV